MLYVHTELVYTKIMLYRLSKRSQCCAVKIEQMYSTHRLYCTVHMERCTEVMLYIWSRCTEVMLYIWSRCTKVMLYMVSRYTQVLQYILSSCTHRSYSTYYCKQVYTQVILHILSRCTHRTYSTYRAGLYKGYTVHTEQVYTQVILFMLRKCTQKFTVQLYSVHQGYCSEYCFLSLTSS